MTLFLLTFVAIYCVVMLSSLDYFDTKTPLMSVFLFGCFILAAVATTCVSCVFLILVHLHIL